MPNDTAVFGGGCFWCTEAVFEELKGVVSVMPGYAGGYSRNPTYELVCSGNGGHAEVIQVTFDPARISYRDLLTVFFATHDPTTRNRQGNDVGVQYRSVILYNNEEQKRQAEAMIAELNASGEFSGPIVTEVKPLESFFEAEEYHHGYFRKNESQGYCQFVISPKMGKFRKRFQQLIEA